METCIFKLAETIQQRAYPGKFLVRFRTRLRSPSFQAPVCFNKDGCGCARPRLPSSQWQLSLERAVTQCLRGYGRPRGGNRLASGRFCLRSGPHRDFIGRCGCAVDSAGAARADFPANSGSETERHCKSRRTRKGKRTKRTALVANPVAGIFARYKTILTGQRLSCCFAARSAKPGCFSP